MSNLLNHRFKKLTLFFLSLIILLAFPKPVQANFIDAIQSTEYNLESFVGGKNLLDPQAPTGILPSVSDTIHIYVAGAVDENGQLLTSGGTGAASMAISSLYNHRPASTATYLAYLKQNLNPASPAFAATNPGSLFTAPIIKLWALNRNIAYLFFIIIFVITGFMIMFRAKLNPQTIIGIQQALPKIIVALILVTFSYAIVGFIIDLVYILNNLIFNVYWKILNISTSEQAHQIHFLNILVEGQGQWPSIWESFLQIFALEKTIGDSSTALSRLFDLILALTLFGVAIKIFFTLLTKYVILILQAAFSPFIFLFTAFPGDTSSVAKSLKSILSAALAFPAIYFILVLSGALLTTSSVTPIKELIGLPPFNQGPTSFIGEVATISKFAALGILMTAPTIPQVIDKALETQPAPVDTSQIAGALRKIPIIGGLIS